MAKISKKAKIFIIALLFVLAIIITVLRILGIVDETLFVIVFFICLMISSTLISILLNEYFQKKLFKKHKGESYKYNLIAFPKPNIKENLNYGLIEVYFDSETIYILNIIEDTTLFFSKEKEEFKTPINSKKFKRTISFYIFKEEKEQNKTFLFNYQGKDFFIASFILNSFNKTMYHVDKVMPNDEFMPYFKKMLSMLDFEIIGNETTI